MIVPEATTPASETPSTTGETRAVKPPLGPSTPDASPTKNVRSARLYSGWCLRPYPPPRGVAGGGLQTTTSSSSIKMRKGLTIEEQEDAYLLKVVEGYCGPPTAVGNLANSFSRSQFSSSSLSAPRRAASCNDDVRPQLIMADDEKLFVEELEGDEIVVKEKSVFTLHFSLPSCIFSEASLTQFMHSKIKSTHCKRKSAAFKKHWTRSSERGVDWTKSASRSVLIDAALDCSYFVVLVATSRTHHRREPLSCSRQMASSRIMACAQTSVFA